MVTILAFAMHLVIVHERFCLRAMTALAYVVNYSVSYASTMTTIIALAMRTTSGENVTWARVCRQW